jgi:16S rRNA (cytosine1402-N4)-methyltransferase
LRSHEGHEPVLLEEVLKYLECRPGGRYVDGTVGGGGYAAAILRESSPSGRLLGVDRDADAVERTRRRLADFGERVQVVQGRFSQLRGILDECGWTAAGGVVLDLGVSSFQLDEAERGFSFAREGPLDMRMDRSGGRSAAELLNTLEESELVELIRRLGEEKFARRIARAVVERRGAEPFENTGQLAETVASAVPKTADSRRIHPATRTFQALRMAVNRELEELEEFLDSALDLLGEGGRLCIVSFHSLEDRRVKERFKYWAKGCRCPREWPVCRCEGRPLAKLLTRKVVRPGDEERGRNPRSRSARLRALEKC